MAGMYNVDGTVSQAVRHSQFICNVDLCGCCVWWKIICFQAVVYVWVKQSYYVCCWDCWVVRSKKIVEILPGYQSRQTLMIVFHLVDGSRERSRSPVISLNLEGHAPNQPHLNQTACEKYHFLLHKVFESVCGITKGFAVCLCIIHHWSLQRKKHQEIKKEKTLNSQTAQQSAHRFFISCNRMKRLG